ncbi:MAG: hypothetical protein HYT48_02210 [Candidatus Vogelbacteria bacterium]|nr:hypothetical protein [Candidatus Vogelbacteria bacterium]
MFNDFIAYAQITVGTGKIENPLKGAVESIPQLVNKLLDLVVQVGFPIVVMMIVYCGFLFVMARGNEDKLKNAKRVLFWTVIGAAIVLGASVISHAICGTIQQLGGTNQC